MAVVMGVIIYVFYLLNNDSAIKMVYSIASYTYGPILGLFAYGMMCKTGVKDKMVPIVCIAAPILSWVIQWWLKQQFRLHHWLRATAAQRSPHNARPVLKTN